MAIERVCIGEITTAHGIKGAVKIRLFAQDVTLFSRPVFCHDRLDNQISVTLQTNCHTYWLATVDGVSSRNDAEKLRGLKLYCPRDTLPETSDGHFYLADIIGIDVRNIKGDKIGTVIAVENFGAEDLLEIKPEQGKSYYLPMRDELVIDINIEENFIVTNAGDEWTSP